MWAQLISLLGGAGGGIIGLFQSGIQMLTQFHERGIAFSRQMGMSLKEARGYTAALTRDTAALAAKYGVTADQIKAVKEGIAEATNRQIILNSQQTEGFLRLNKLVGQDTLNKFSEEMMQGMGAQINTVENAVSKAYATAAKNGLGAKKTADMIANNLQMVNKLSFKNGVDGLTKMAVQAQKVGMSLQSVENVAKTFMDFDSSIEHAAQLQMLGGAAGAMGGNPLDMMYEANYDPEALQDRMIKMMSGYATFDAKTGMSKVNGMGMDFIRNIAKAMGMDEGEAVKVAKKNAEIKYKEEKLGGMNGLSEEAKNAILNKSYVENGRVYVNDANGERRDITGGNIDKDLLNQLTQFAGMDDHALMEQQATSLTSIQEQLDGFSTSAAALAAKPFNQLIPDIQKGIAKLAGEVLPQIQEVSENLLQRVGELKDSGVLHWIWKAIEKIIQWTGKFFTWATSSWPTLIAAMMGIGPMIVTALFKPSKVIKGAKAAVRGGKKLFNWLKTPRGGGAGLKWGTRLGRAAKGLGLGTLGAVANMGIDWAVDKGKMEKGSGLHKATKIGATALEYGGLGAAIGSVIPGVGTAVGAGVGATIGGVKGWYDSAGGFGGMWEDVKKVTSGLAEKITECFKWCSETIPAAVNKAVGFVKAIPEKVKNFIWGVLDKIEAAFNWVKDKIDMLIGGAKKAVDKVTEVVNDPVGAAKNAAKGAWNWVKGKFGFAEGGPIPGNSYAGDNVTVRANSGEAIITPKQFYKLFDMTETILRAKPVGANDFRYNQGSTEVSKVGGNTITVKDFNINIGGTLRLEAGNNLANVNMNELLKDTQFVSQLKDVITNAISSSYNGGRHMNDIATMRGMAAQTTTIGRRA